jgi:hypothetical protein
MLARKINRSKWGPKHDLRHDAIRADAVTGCLKTMDDTLSMWRCKDDLNDLNDVFLALATGPKNDGFDTLDIVVVPENTLEDAEIAMEPTEGATAIRELRSRHVDLIALDLDKLAALARIIASQVRNSGVKRLTEGQIKQLVTDAANSGRVQLDELPKQLREKLQARA